MKLVTGNLLDRPSGINVMIHQANIEGNMGAGIAKQIARRYPEVAEVDKKTHKSGNAQLGRISGYKYNWGYLYNIYAQSIRFDSLAGCRTSYDALYCATRQLNAVLKKQGAIVQNDIIIGFPYLMGCALGGGNWSVYSEILADTLGRDFDMVCVKLG